MNALGRHSPKRRKPPDLEADREHGSPRLMWVGLGLAAPGDPRRDDSDQGDDRRRNRRLRRVGAPEAPGRAVRVGARRDAVLLYGREQHRGGVRSRFRCWGDGAARARVASRALSGGTSRRDAAHRRREPKRVRSNRGRAAIDAEGDPSRCRGAASPRNGLPRSDASDSGILPGCGAEQHHARPHRTFVETPRFTGGVYRASGWIHVGTTKGRGRYDRDKLYDKLRKDVWLRPLRKDLGAHPQLARQSARSAAPSPPERRLARIDSCSTRGVSERLSQASRVSFSTWDGIRDRNSRYRV